MFKRIIIILSLVYCLNNLCAQNNGSPLILQDMTWQDVRDYLKTSDMVIIPLGSTEQHGPHLPLGTDYYEAMEMSKRISAKTNVVVAQILMVGYSKYHMGFPGTMTLKPETMEQVLFECVENLIHHGFKKFMFFSYHGRNDIVENNLLHKINFSTEASAVTIGLGNSFYERDTLEFF